MNRRGFISAMLKAGVGCSILPAALTYNRVWKLPPKRHIWVIEWEDVKIGGVDQVWPNGKVQFVESADGIFAKLLQCVGQPIDAADPVIQKVFGKKRALSQKKFVYSVFFNNQSTL